MPKINKDRFFKTYHSTTVDKVITFNISFISLNRSNSLIFAFCCCWRIQFQHLDTFNYSCGFCKIKILLILKFYLYLISILIFLKLISILTMEWLQWKYDKKHWPFLVASLAYACITSVGLTTASPGTCNACYKG